MQRSDGHRVERARSRDARDRSTRALVPRGSPRGATTRHIAPSEHARSVSARTPTTTVYKSGTVQTIDSIGFVGLGNMGHPMSARLGAAGLRVAAFDVDPDARTRAGRNAGANEVSTLAAVAAGAQAVILTLPNSTTVGQVVIEAGLLEAMQRGALLIDMSSSDATDRRALAARVAERGVRFLDASVSGGVAGAQAGALTIMVGGRETDLSDCRLAEALADDADHTEIAKWVADRRETGTDER
jgi:6-phosphogluconate dehydrogenase